MGIDTEANAFAERDRISVRANYDDDHDYDERMVRLATVYTREDVALLCFYSRRIYLNLASIRWAVGATLLVLIAHVVRHW